MRSWCITKGEDMPDRHQYMLHTVTTHDLWWSTPKVLLELKDPKVFNANLARIILEEERKITKNENRTPVAGLESGMTTYWRQYNVLNWAYPECAELGRVLLIGVREFFALIGDPNDPDCTICGISAWANVLRHGESLHIHHHDQCFVNSHYIVRSGYGSQLLPNEPDCGHTVYYRPGFVDRSHGERQGETINPWDVGWRVSIPPVDGQMHFFPGYVRHEVRPYLGDEERISIAFEIYVKKQKPLIYFGGPQWFIPK
jgi:uncharacterized protein (TIGR02466 family)